MGSGFTVPGDENEPTPDKKGEGNDSGLPPVDNPRAELPPELEEQLASNMEEALSEHAEEIRANADPLDDTAARLNETFKKGSAENAGAGEPSAEDIAEDIPADTNQPHDDGNQPSPDDASATSQPGDQPEEPEQEQGAGPGSDPQPSPSPDDAEPEDLDALADELKKSGFAKGKKSQIDLGETLEDFLKKKSKAYRNFWATLENIYGEVYYTPAGFNKLDNALESHLISRGAIKQPFKIPFVDPLYEFFSDDPAGEFKVSPRSVQLYTKQDVLTEEKAMQMALVLYMNPAAHVAGVNLEGTFEQRKMLHQALEKVMSLNPHAEPILIHNPALVKELAEELQPGPAPSQPHADTSKTDIKTLYPFNKDVNDKIVELIRGKLEPASGATDVTDEQVCAYWDENEMRRNRIVQMAQAALKDGPAPEPQPEQPESQPSEQNAEAADHPASDEPATGADKGPVDDTPAARDEELKTHKPAGDTKEVKPSKSFARAAYVPTEGQLETAALALRIKHLANPDTFKASIAEVKEIFGVGAVKARRIIDELVKQNIIAKDEKGGKFASWRVVDFNESAVAEIDGVDIGITATPHSRNARDNRPDAGMPG